MDRFITYLKNSQAELAKVAWPTRQQAARLTVVVVIFSLALALFTGAADKLFATILEKFILKV
jgi:preprotein translocase subunit SecE